MRQPSDKLMCLLTELKLCSVADLEACEPRVRRLCHDLPDFDSVWIDALVQQQTLTPWQADVLHSRSPSRLLVEEFSLRDQIGNHSYHAVSMTTGRHVVLHQLRTNASAADAHSAWLRLQLSRLEEVNATAPPCLELPRRIVCRTETGGNAVSYLASGFVPGWNVQELLIRGGRMPWPVVAEIGRQLLSALSWMEEHGLVHGDIHLQNIRLTPQGQAVLVSTMCHPLARQGLSLTAELRLNDVDTLAPERVGSGMVANARSELYAVGCVLWQMLTARPPFLSADPVSKVLQSQNRDIADVRSLVPDCPDEMARLIHNLVRRSPELRPESAAAAVEKWRALPVTGNHRTRRLLSSMPDRSRHTMSLRTQSTHRRSRMATVLTTSLMIAAFTGYGIQRGLLPGPLTLSRSVSRPETTTDSEHRPDITVSTHEVGPFNSPVNSPVDGLLNMPQPDAAGVVVLQSGRTYEAADLEFAGVMHIESTGVDNAIVLVSTSKPWRLTASQIVLSHVSVQTDRAAERMHGGAAENRSVAAILCECDVLSVDHCLLDSGSGNGRDRALLWEAHTAVTSVVSVSNSVFSGSGYGLWLSQPPARCRLNNVLVTSRRAAVRCDVQERGRGTVRLNVHRVTQADNVSFLDVVLLPSNERRSSDTVQVVMECGESVLAAQTALVQFAGPADWPLSNASVEFLLPERGNPTIVPPDVSTAVGFDHALQTVVALPETQVRAEALLIAVPIFHNAGPPTDASPFAPFELQDYEGPKLNPRLPGIDVAALPVAFPIQ
ncbi:MAG: protein kinase [Planctomycetaceae bacterium]